MGRFRFRLSSVLKLREATRDERRAQLAEAYRADEILQTRLAELDRIVADLKGRYLQAAGPGPIEVDRLLEAQRYELIVTVERKTVERQRTALAVEIEKRRENLVAADRDVRVLEKLRETQAERHRDDENRQEMKVLDEVAGRAASREYVL
ncbi:MAG: flagellar export protein FliJ [Pirellulales bacterium]